MATMTTMATMQCVQLNATYAVLKFIIDSKWLIKDWGWIPICRWAFWEFSELPPNLVLPTSFFMQKYLLEIQESPNQCKTILSREH